MTRIHFYASEEDNYQLRSFIDSLDLFVYPSKLDRFGKTKSVAKNVFHGYISFLESGQLHTFGERQVSTIKDPIIMWIPSYTVEHEGDKYIIHGCLDYEFEDPNREEEIKKGKSIFGKLSRWIRKNWPPPEKGDFCRGSGAQKLIQFEEYLPRGIPPNIEIQHIKT